MFRVNPDGSISVGMLPEEKPVEVAPAPVEEVKEPAPAPEKPKTTRRKKKTE